jgi:predicted RNA-binding Zn-ribbon protein involved in translation (DUF1610 family)
MSDSSRDLRSDADAARSSGAAIEQPAFDYFECPECGFSSVQRADFSGHEDCPLCAGDSGHDVLMRRRTCLETDRPEGRDAREDLSIKASDAPENGEVGSTDASQVPGSTS